ncbi:MAG: ABC transporter permease [Caldilineaceae bacterium SB0661_bin_32]|uniref:ABC transporter permease n=1 Tax=Caldilineaceae bacterium SB0661_bin_32 TaxID=2605255 RepID=A0A6B1DAD7_9CHLR|nr:ABC transporter permease [Caldilineaceae bacterium SB0661_bin_32]
MEERTDSVGQIAALEQPPETIKRGPLAKIRQLRKTSKPVLLAGTILLLVLLSTLFPGVLSPHDPNEIHPELSLSPPSLDFILGTDEFGRDIFSRIIFGTRVAIVISSASVGLAFVIGIPLGLISGLFGGLADGLTMRVMDAVLAFPSLIFTILIVAALGASPFSIIVSIGFLFTPRFARLVRGSVLVLKDVDFVVASRACGAGNSRIMFRTILPNTMAPILIQITLGMALAISIEAGLSYLGLGIQPPTATWGTMLRDAQRYLYLAPWYTLAPGIIIFVVILVLNFFGDRLRDALDPRLKRV